MKFDAFVTFLYVCLFFSVHFANKRVHSIVVNVSTAIVALGSIVLINTVNTEKHFMQSSNKYPLTVRINTAIDSNRFKLIRMAYH